MMMSPTKLVWQIFVASILTILVTVIAVSWYCATAFHEFYLRDTEGDLEARAQLLSIKVQDFLQDNRINSLREYCKEAGRASVTRITVIAADGKVIADSNQNAEVMDNHRDRAEVAKALAGEVGVSRRYSKTLDENLIYVAIPLRIPALPNSGADSPGTGSVAVLRTSASVASLNKTMEQITEKIEIGAIMVMLFAGMVTLVISRNVSKPLEQMTETAERLGKGDFTEKMAPLLKKTASLEVVALAAAMDRMALLLDEKIEAIITQKNQLETVFSSMVEAVLAIDTEERVINVNAAAAQIFAVERSWAQGKLMQQVVRNVQLLQEISKTLATREAVVAEIVFHDSVGSKFLQTSIVSLSNGTGENVGVLVVMNDVTRIRRLENIRRDFVANVSHELRTPITSIHGYIETLLDGALESREDAVQFLGIVLRQSERLTTIIDDLLALSRIEEEADRGAIPLKTQPLCPVLGAARQTCQLQAEEAGIALVIECSEQIVAEINATLLEQAVVNLLMNAITHSRKGDEIRVSAGCSADPEKDNGKVTITVKDSGTGIAKEHLPRLFERFYRSDKARSRARGGSGLGLAIVKHIVEAHNGEVTVKSIEGQGAEFTMVVHGKLAS